jgi:hypothetical protein
MQQPAMLVLSPQQLPMIQLPLNFDVNPLLEQAVLAMQHEYMPDSSNNQHNASPVVSGKIWRLPIKNLHKLMKQRRNCVQKAIYVKKLKAELALYTAIDKLDKLQYEL